LSIKATEEHIRRSHGKLNIFNDNQASAKQVVFHIWKKASPIITFNTNVIGVALLMTSLEEKSSDPRIINISSARAPF